MPKVEDNKIEDSEVEDKVAQSATARDVAARDTTTNGARDGVMRTGADSKANAGDKASAPLMSLSSGPAQASRPHAKTERQRHPLIELTLVRLREFAREPEVVFWVFVFPVLLAFALGIAFRNTAPERTRVAVVASESTTSRNAVVEKLRGVPDIDAFAMSPTEAADALRNGRVALVVRPVGNAAPNADVNTTTSSTTTTGASNQSFEYRFDPTRPESRTARFVVDDALQRANGRADVFNARDEQVMETGARYIDFLIPGLIGLNLMGSAMWGLGFSIVQARMRKLLKRYAATPMRRSHYLLSFMLSRLVFLFFEVAAVIGFAWLVFGVEVRGSLPGLIIVLLVGAAMFAGIGLLVAARPVTIEGVSGWMNAIMLPMWLFSGTFFSSARFPESLQPLIQALPLTALNNALRSVMNDGSSLASVLPQIALMTAWGIVTFVLALRTFRWQ